jgi:hypothetical protein
MHANARHQRVLDTRRNTSKWFALSGTYRRDRIREHSWSKQSRAPRRVTAAT